MHSCGVVYIPDQVIGNEKGAWQQQSQFDDRLRDHSRHADMNEAAAVEERFGEFRISY